MIRWSTKKRVQDRPERLAVGHRAASVQAGSAKASNRRLASLQQLRGDGQVDGGRDGVDVAHERRELVEPRGWVNALAIPAQQTPDRERVTQAVQPGGRDAVGDGEAQGARTRRWNVWLAVPG